MINVSESLNKVLYEDSTIKFGAGCTIEYNMNNLLDNISVSYSDSLDQYYPTIVNSRVNVFKRLFPIDSIVKPNRPEKSGVKYYIMLENDFNGDAGANIPDNYRNPAYSISTKPRMYFPATTNVYKYWVTPENQPVDITVRYIQHTATISEAYSTGPSAVNYPNRVVYKTTTAHGFSAGQTVTTSGGTGLNLTGTIDSIISPTEFLILVDNNIAAATSTGGTATLSSPTKAALANKVVVRFEKYHKAPSTCDLTITYADNSVASGTSSLTVTNGNLFLYWNGTSWSTNPPHSSSQPISWPAPREIKSIRLHGTGAAGVGRVFAVTEISARWVKDISSDIVTFDIQKESTANADSILPVGTITANSLQMNLVKFDQSNIKVVPYNRDNPWDATPNNLIYLYKDVQVFPHFIVYHSNGAVTDGAIKYDRISQGTFYIDSFDISTYGETQISALDGAKYLMQTIPVDLYLEEVPVTSIIMTLLDTIGFTNYNFNLVSGTDDSVPVLSKWWTDNQRTTWEHIQELCRDIQMNAFFDENNILQFYSRDNIYNKSGSDWTFYNSPTVVGSATRLPSIIEFSKKEIASANQVKIIWKTPISSLYEGDAEGLWISEPTYVVAGGLQEEISSSEKSENVNFHLDFSTINNNQEILSSFNFNGYFLINSEIFEYDAIEYEYTLEGQSNSQTAWIESKSQWASVRAGSKVGSEYFKPTGKYRIKKRAMFGTTAATHKPVIATTNQSWIKITEQEWSA